MRASFASFVLAACAIPQALATLFVTSPTDTTTCTAGTSCSITWADQGGAPTLAQIGQVTVGLYTGNSQQQTLLQLITPTPINAATTSTIQFIPDLSVGPNSSLYFIRFNAVTFKDPTTPTQPFLAFSHKFTLNGMTGVFNATVQSQINAITSAGSATPSNGLTTLSVSGANSKSTTPTATPKSSPSPTGAASTNHVGISAMVGVMAALGYWMQ